MEDGTEDDEDGRRGNNVADPATGRVRLMERRCGTCIFRPGNRMHLEPGRVKDMVDTCVERQGHVVCHDTLAHNDKGLPGAVCRGFEQHPAGAARSLAVRFLKATGRVTLVDPETGALRDADYRALPPVED